MKFTYFCLGFGCHAGYSIALHGMREGDTLLTILGAALMTITLTASVIISFITAPARPSTGE